MRTIASRIESAAAGTGSITFVNGDAAERLTWGELHEQASAWAGALQACGAGPGVHVAVLGPTTRRLVTALEAVWLSGATVVVLPLPMRLGSIEEFIAQTRARVAGADVSLVLADPDLAGFLPAGGGAPPVMSFDELAAAAVASPGYRRPSDDPGELAVLQFTSGSTADPKGVMLPHRTICANLDAIAAATDLDPSADVLVSWLPLYHDMGLVGMLLLPATTGTDLVLGAPQDFMSAPRRWLEWLSHFGGTATAGPNFAWALATRALRDAGGLDLSPLRVALNGAEPVDPDTVERFVDAAVTHGMRPGAVFPAFGMAELMIGGTFPAPLAGLRTDRVDRRVLETERYAAPVAEDVSSARRLALLGRALPGLELRIVDPETGSTRRDREVGELQIRGTSVTPGYYRRPDLNVELFDGEWLRTGDLGYLLDDELVLCGRIKDIIIVGGRNLYPEDVERAVSDVDGVRAGNVIAFGIEANGKEGVVVVAETREVDSAHTRRNVAQQVRDAIGLPPKDIVLVPPGTLPKTSSGKLQRSLCRRRYLEDQLAPV